MRMVGCCKFIATSAARRPPNRRAFSHVNLWVLGRVIAPTWTNMHKLLLRPFCMTGGRRTLQHRLREEARYIHSTCSAAVDSVDVARK